MTKQVLVFLMCNCYCKESVDSSLLRIVDALVERAVAVHVLVVDQVVLHRVTFVLLQLVLFHVWRVVGHKADKPMEPISG